MYCRMLTEQSCHWYPLDKTGNWTIFRQISMKMQTPSTSIEVTGHLCALSAIFIHQSALQKWLAVNGKDMAKWEITVICSGAPWADKWSERGMDSCLHWKNYTSSWWLQFNYDGFWECLHSGGIKGEEYIRLAYIPLVYPWTTATCTNSWCLSIRD